MEKWSDLKVATVKLLKGTEIKQSYSSFSIPGEKNLIYSIKISVFVPSGC